MAKNDLFFWNNWRTTYRFLYLSALVLLAVAILLYLINYIVGASAIIQWKTSNELQDIEITLQKFIEGLFTFSANVQTYFVKEKFLGTPMAVNVSAARWLAFWLGIGSVLVLSTIWALPRLWYVASIGIFILLLASFKFDLLQIFGLTNNTFFIFTVVIFAGLSYYFHAFKRDVAVPKQVLIFAAITVLVSLCIIYLSQSSFPVLTIISYGIIIPILVSLVFVVMIAHEIVKGFLYLVTQPSSIGSNNSFLHFTLITFFYLGNLVLAFLRNKGTIQWDIFYIDAFFLFLISMIIGIWGYRKRSSLFDHIIPFAPYGALVYLALAIISTATIGYFFATANDPMIEMLEDVIIFSHLGFGIAFYLYVFTNFRQLMQRNLPAYKVIYQPRQYPFFYVRGVGLIVIMALFFQADMFPFFQSIAGYYNGIGDLYFAKKEYFLAEQYYKRASQYEFQNHKSNYALASLAQIQGDEPTAIHYYKQALLKKPSPYAYANLSYLYGQQRLLFESIFTLREGISAFPKSGELFNNLALLYNQTNLLDSAYIYYNLANEYAEEKDVVQTNLLAFWATTQAGINVDSLLKETEGNDYISLKNNRLLLANRHGITEKSPFSPALANDSVLTRERFAYLFNYILNHKEKADSTLGKRLLTYLDYPTNTVFTEDLLLSQAIKEYYGGNKKEAFGIINSLTDNQARGAYFLKTQGLWWLQEGGYQSAAKSFNQATLAGDSTLLPNFAIALSEARQWSQVLPVWEHLAKSPDEETRLMAERMQTIAQAHLDNRLTEVANQLDDAGKVLLLHFTQDQPLSQVPNTITQPEYKNLALLDLASFYLEKDSVSKADAIVQQIENKGQLSELNFWRLNELRLQLLQAKKDYKTLLATVDTISLNPAVQDKKLYFKAVAFAHTRELKKAESLFNQAIKRFPINPVIITQAARFYDKQLKNPDKAYTILLEAMQLDPYSANLLKAYILQSLELRLFSYAETALINLKELTSDADYQAFRPFYEAKKASMEKALQDWE